MQKQTGEHEKPESAANQASQKLNLTPSPLKVVKKPGNISIKNFLPSSPSFHPTDLRRCKCEGFLFGNGAVITLPEHIWGLILLGSYGKGSFSRSVPCHHHIPTPVDLKQLSRKRKNPTNPTGILRECEKRIKLHCQWRNEQISNCPSSDDPFPTQSSASTSVIENMDYKDFISMLDGIKSRDPYVIDEYLHLGPEETFYLTYELKVLEVVCLETSTSLTSASIWAVLAKNIPSFPYKYAAYKHFREGNWVPKQGHKFGVDLLLYKISPIHFHSSFAVLVRGGKQPGPLWKDIVTVTRACQATGKDLLLCDVTFPEDVDINVPTCVDHVTIVDTIVNWWVPEQDRDM